MAQVDDSKAGGNVSDASWLLRSPFIRLMIALAVFAVAVVVIGLVVVSLLTAQRRQPIEIEVYPGAHLEVQQRVAIGHDQLFYSTEDDVEAVVAFFAARYGRDEDQRCVRIENSALDDDPTQPPFEVKCTVDNSIVNALQSALITIQPRISGDYAGRTIILVDRFWEP